MANDEKIKLLAERLEILLKRQELFSKEVSDLKKEIEQLTHAEETIYQEQAPAITTVVENKPEEKKPSLPSYHEYMQQQATQKKSQPFLQKAPKQKSNLEKFIGENLANKIGIIITIIGVAIGAKYAIDHQLISPVARIIFGYIIGVGLMFFAIKLKPKYENFSAVLLSGAMAILYFITFAAYSFYSLFPQIPAFVLMVIFTVFTVVAAINYNKQVIAHIGLVGAYAVPFLLSDGSGKVAILFSYMAIINIGILAISFKKYWKPLFYSSFGLSWIIFISWFSFQYQASLHFSLALIFLSIFFIIFYTCFLAYKLLQKEQFQLDDIFLLLANTFIFYGIGYGILSEHTGSDKFLGLFTVINALVHLSVSYIIYRLKLADKNLFYMISGLVLVFMTIAIPVQLNGNWVTLLWAGEAAVLFWIGKTKAVSVYEKLSYPIIFLSFVSIIDDWTTAYSGYSQDFPAGRITPLINIHFLSGLLFIGAFGFMQWVNSRKHEGSSISKYGLGAIVSMFIPAVLIFVTYNIFRLEIGNYWDQLFTDSTITIKNKGADYATYFYNYDFNYFKEVWVFNYSFFFLSALALINIKRIKSELLTYLNISLILFCMLLFLTRGAIVLGELRDSYLNRIINDHYHRSVFNLLIRYVSYMFTALSLVACYYYIKQSFIKRNLTTGFDIVVHLVILTVASNELINWMSIAKHTESDKLGLSILWGVYSLLLISLGIQKKKRHLRIAAIVLFGITLIKLLLYDLSELDTIAKTIVLVSLGILLLIISFLYNKYKHIISGDEE